MSGLFQVASRGGDARPDSPVRGERVLQLIETGLSRVERALGKVLPIPLNPLAQAGAIANTTFLVACATGILLLVWYVPSVHEAYDSLERLGWAGQLVRSLHRYSSDACMLFVLLHAAQIVVARRFTGARWIAWVTGVALLATLWFVGWLGYWLVWDERAHLVALGSSRLIDDLPIFTEPLSRSLLTDETINSLLFFMIFFMHMLIPLAMGVGLWVHITRLSRPRFLTGRVLTAWTMASLVVVSIVWPATSAPAARMTVLPSSMTMDGWYLLPLALTERLGAGALWAIVLVGGVILFSMPRWMRRRVSVPAVVDVAKCNACTLCYEDCPYDAIRMVPRTDGKPYPTQAEVNPDKCVGCGICAGSCNSAGIGLPTFPVVDARRTVEGWIDTVLAAGGAPHLAFLCGSSAGRHFQIDPVTGECPQLPEYRVFPVPCTGWVHALTIERALKRGAAGVLLVSCGHGEVTFREGAKWTDDRIAGERLPILREQKVDKGNVRNLRAEPHAVKALQEEARTFAQGNRRAGMSNGVGKKIVVGVGAAAALSLVTFAASDVPYRSPKRPEAELMVSFRHPGRNSEVCRQRTTEELEALPLHMRSDQVCERGRASVRLRVFVDGVVVRDSTHPARGISGDGNSLAMESIHLEPGERHVDVWVGDSAELDVWEYRTSRTVDFGRGSRRVLLFDRNAGFTWHGGEPTAAVSDELSYTVREKAGLPGLPR